MTQRGVGRRSFDMARDGATDLAEQWRDITAPAQADEKLGLLAVACAAEPASDPRWAVA